MQPIGLIHSQEAVSLLVALFRFPIDFTGTFFRPSAKSPRKSRLKNGKKKTEKIKKINKQTY